MKRGLAAAAILLAFAAQTYAQELPSEPTQNPNAEYRLFRTQNIYTFLRLDTRAGLVWQVQWGDKDHSFIEPINLEALASDGGPGRFTLYPTSNIYTFMLLDQETSGVWHIQWGKALDRFIKHID